MYCVVFVSKFVMIAYRCSIQVVFGTHKNQFQNDEYALVFANISDVYHNNKHIIKLFCFISFSALIYQNVAFLRKWCQLISLDYIPLMSHMPLVAS